MSPLILVMRHWKYVLIAALLVLLSFSLVGISQKNSEIESIRNQNELDVTRLKAEYIETARDMERRHYEQQIRAVNEYKEREMSILSDASIANDAVSRLSDTITNISATSKLDAQLRDRYIDTSTSYSKSVLENILRWDKLLIDLATNSNSCQNPTEGVNSACTNPVDNSPKEEIPIIMIPNN